MVTTWRIGGLLMELRRDIPGSRLDGPGEVRSVFVHSANYRMSLGSGSSHVVFEIIEAEKAERGKSALEREMNRIRKTPVGRAAVTSGGAFGPDCRRDEAFDHIVHAVIPGPRIDAFEDVLAGLVREVLSLTREVSRGCPLDLCLPIFGVNNFGYPLGPTCGIFAQALAEAFDGSEVRGRLSVWANRDHWEAFETALNEVLR